MRSDDTGRAARRGRVSAPGIMHAGVYQLGLSMTGLAPARPVELTP